MARRTGAIDEAPAHAGRRRWSGARGQTTAFVASMLFVMVIFVSVVANVGQAVNRRIALQTIADTGAYTGASVMAVGYNQLAYWNTWMQRAWAVFTVVPGPMWQAFQLHAIPFPNSCSVASQMENVYRIAMTALHGVYTVQNIGYAFLATSEARRVSEYNASDLFPTDFRRLTYAESDLPQILAGHGFGQIAPSEQVPDGTEAEALGWWGDVTINSDSSNWYFCLMPNPVPPFIPPQIPMYRDRNYLVWNRKQPNRVDSFVWVVTSPRTKAMMFDRWFGGDIIPEMKAVAVAKPIGGSIEEGDNSYKTKMTPVFTVLAANRLAGRFLPTVLQRFGFVGIILDPEYDREVRIVTH